jgi:FtsZ-binding cell division protein ZapB
MDIFEIERKIKENLETIGLKNNEIQNLQKDNYKLLQDRKIAKFELVVENIEIGQVIELPSALPPLR